MRGAHRDQFNRASRTNCQQDSQPSPKPAGCPEKELILRSKYSAPSAGIGCSDGICKSTTGTCIRGHDAENTPARTARLKKPKRIPPSWIGRTTCRTPMKKQIPSDTNRGAGTGAEERRLVNSPPFRILLAGLCSFLPSALCRFGRCPSQQANHLGGSREGRSVLWTGSKPCWERNGSFTSADGSDHVAWEQVAIPFLLTCWPGPDEWDSSDP